MPRPPNPPAPPQASTPLQLPVAGPEGAVSAPSSETTILPARRLLQLPLPAYSDETASTLESCNHLLGSMPSQNVVFDRLRKFDPSVESMDFSCLRHRLSEYVNAPQFDLEQALATERCEAQLYARWRKEFTGRLDLLGMKRLVSLATGDSTLRRNASLLASKDGSMVLPMVPWRAAHKRITELSALVDAGEFGFGLIAAIRLRALINNAHAFHDGNGRLGRFLFNLALHRGGMPPSSYIPLKVMALLACGGYEIRLQEVMVFDDWQGFISYHCDIVRIIHKMQEPSLVSLKEGHQAHA